MAVTDAEAARKRAERRRRIMAQISALEREVLELEEVKGNYDNVKSSLFRISSAIDSAYSGLNTAHYILNLDYPGKRTDKMNRNFFDDVISENSVAKGNIADFINYVSAKINDLCDAIRERESEIRSLRNSL